VESKDDDGAAVPENVDGLVEPGDVQELESEDGNDTIELGDDDGTEDVDGLVIPEDVQELESEDGNDTIELGDDAEPEDDAVGVAKYQEVEPDRDDRSDVDIE